MTRKRIKLADPNMREICDELVFWAWVHLLFCCAAALAIGG